MWRDSGADPSHMSEITVLYVGADDCGPCRVWQRGDGVAFRASPEFARLTYREVKSPALYDVLRDENWPVDLRAYRDRLGPDAGVPMWFVIADHEVIGKAFGASQWRVIVWPKLQSILR